MSQLVRSPPGDSDASRDSAVALSVGEASVDALSGCCSLHGSGGFLEVLFRSRRVHLRMVTFFGI